jgi:ubiquinone/menaquinone biosynthesis C-methylase UbiE
MGFYADQILPRCIDFALSRRPILRARERITEGLSGEVLEIGFGSGLNLPYYPASVSKIYAVDPCETGKRLARERIAACSIPIEWAGLDGQTLELADASVDAVLSTFTFCTIPNLDAALAELRRVLRPGGQLHFLEHGRSPEPGVAKWQDRLTPIQRRMAGGCHLNRAMDDKVRAAGFELHSLETYYLKGPKVGTYVFEGRARAAQ